MRIVLLSLVLAGCAACADGGNTMTSQLPTCTTMDECIAHDGERVEVIATYTVWDPLPVRARNHPPARQVMLKFGSEEGPFLEPWGHQGHMRPLDEISRFQGKKVRIVGTFRREMPPHPTDPPEAASLAGACIQRIESVQPAD